MEIIILVHNLLEFHNNNNNNPHLPAQGTGYPRYGGSDTNVAQQQQQPPISPNEFYNNLPQHTGFQNYPSYPQNQGTAPDNSYLSQQPSGASTRQQQQQPPIQTYPNQLQPSEPDFEDDDNEEPVNTPQIRVAHNRTSSGSCPLYPTNDIILILIALILTNRLHLIVMIIIMWQFHYLIILHQKI